MSKGAAMRLHVSAVLLFATALIAMPCRHAGAAEPAVKFVPMPMKVEGEVIRTEIYLEAAAADQTPTPLGPNPDHQILTQILAAAAKKDAQAYAPLTWS